MERERSGRRGKGAAESAGEWARNAEGTVLAVDETTKGPRDETSPRDRLDDERLRMLASTSC